MVSRMVKVRSRQCYRHVVVRYLFASRDPLYTRRHVAQMRQIEIDQLQAHPLHEKVLSDVSSYSLFDGDHL